MLHFFKEDKKVPFEDRLAQFKKKLDEADAILIGAGSGLSTAAGYTYTGERFLKNFKDFHEAYGIEDMYSGGFYPFKTMEEYWAWWSRHIYCNRYDLPPSEIHRKLLALAQKKNDYFVLTTNVDHLFQLNGFDKERLFYTQGDYGLVQCSKGCHARTYDNEHMVRHMLKAQKNMRVPSDCIPYCPKCGRPMAPNLRADEFFVEDEGWKAAQNRYQNFLQTHENSRIIYLELGVGQNTPAIIKYPFWRYVYNNENAIYVCINKGESYIPDEIVERSITFDEGIGEVLSAL